MMEPGIGTYTYGWAFSADGGPARDEEWLVETAVSLGVSLVQVADNLPLHTFSQERLQRFRSLLTDRDMCVEVGARRLCGENLVRYAGICHELDARILRFVTDDEGYAPTVEELVELLRRHVNVLDKNGVVLAIENHDRMRAAELASVIEGVGSPYVGICLDTANSLGAGEGIEEVLNILGRYTVNLHIKDYGIRRLAHKQGFVIDGRIAGEGVLDVPSIVRRIGSYGKCRSCVLEQWVPLEDDMAGTIEKERAWAERGIAYLREMPGMAGKKA